MSKDVFSRLFPEFLQAHPSMPHDEVMPAFQRYVMETIKVSCNRCGKEDAPGVHEWVRDVPPTAQGFYCADCATLVRVEWTQECAQCGKAFRLWHAGVFYCENCLIKPNRRRETRRVSYARRQAEQDHLPATLTIDEWMQTIADFDGRCAYCGKAMEVLEHFIPLIQKGGTTADNCVPACNHCNAGKGGSHPNEFKRFDSYPKVRAYLATRKQA